MKSQISNLQAHARSFAISLLAVALGACGAGEPGSRPVKKAAAGEVSPAKRPAAPGSAALPGDAPRLAIVIDDLGRERAPAARLLAMKLPLTLSVIPHLPFSVETATLARQHGQEVMLHLPMAANGNRAVAAEPGELRPRMSPLEVAGAIAGMLESVPHAGGVNNHQGSSATQDRALMAEVMRVLAARNLYFLDSRTSAASVAYDVAQDAGMRAAYRTEFLDNTPERAVVQRQLHAAERRARQQGWAIAIGHPHEVTITVLEELLPQIQSRGVRLVFVSQIAR